MRLMVLEQPNKDDMERMVRKKKSVLHKDRRCHCEARSIFDRWGNHEHELHYPREDGFINAYDEHANWFKNMKEEQRFLT